MARLAIQPTSSSIIYAAREGISSNMIEATTSSGRSAGPDPSSTVSSKAAQRTSKAEEASNNPSTESEDLRIQPTDVGCTQSSTVLFSLARSRNIWLVMRPPAVEMPQSNLAAYPSRDLFMLKASIVRHCLERPSLIAFNLELLRACPCSVSGLSNPRVPVCVMVLIVIMGSEWRPTDTCSIAYSDSSECCMFS